MHAPDLFPGLLAYVGIGASPELIPHFVALLSLLGAAAFATLQWPVSMLLRYVAPSRRQAGRNAGDTSPKNDVADDPGAP
ncbi:MAG TPA: hypothetical protein VJ783_12540 [Pirellulales bacterium]|nr:hypothetical protein [Pirellulales bacterium]